MGSVRLIMSGGVSAFTSDYKPYGNAYQKTGTLVFGYTGKRYDNSIGGLYYYNARWYDPDYGRFITEDTRMGSQSDPMSLNRYVYARDNPEKYVDPTGHVGQMMLTDFNDEYYVPGSTTSSCANGICTVTTTEMSGGYQSTTTTTFGATNAPGGTTTAMSTTMAEISPSGVIRVTNSWSVTDTATGSTKSDTTTTRYNPAVANAWVEAIGLAGAGVVATVIGYYSVDTIATTIVGEIPILSYGSAYSFGWAGYFVLGDRLLGGTFEEFEYLGSNGASANPEGVFASYSEGFSEGILQELVLGA